MRCSLVSCPLWPDAGNATAFQEQLAQHGGRLLRLAGLLVEADGGQAVAADTCGVRQPVGQRRPLLQTPQRHPQRPLQRLALVAEQALRGPGVAHVAAEAAETATTRSTFACSIALLGMPE